MAISLNNHESRITALENKTAGSGYIWTLCCAHIQEYGGRTYFFIPKNVTKIRIAESIGIPGERYSSLTDVAYTPKSNMRTFSGETMLEYIGELTDHYKYYYRNESGGDDNYLTVWGLLKLYYNFSYNIYSLANSISFHFFKCLINSFKGGVKEIWQLA